MIMKVVQFALGVSLLLSGSPPATAQNGSASIGAQSSQPILTSCEENIALLSGSHQVAGKDGLIIAIARLGNGEHRRELNRRRLHNVLVYLTEFDWQRAPKTVIKAEGERVRGFGRVELYVGGKLLAVLGVKRNGDLLVGSCEPDNIRPVKAERNLYPYLYTRSRRLTRRHKGRSHD
jgi:hypothetical protein